MKKLLFIAIFVLLFAIAPTNSNVEGATYTDIDWVCDDTYDPTFALIGTVHFGTNANEITVNIPESSLHVRDNGSYIFGFRWLDDTGGQVDYSQAADIFGNFMGAGYTYILNFDVLDIDPDAVTLEIIVPQNFDFGVTNICPVGYADFMNEESSVTISVGELLDGIMRFEFIENTVYVGSELQTPHHGLSNLIPIPADITYLQIRGTRSIEVRRFDEISEIYFYDEDEILLNEVYLGDYIARTDGEEWPWVLDIPFTELPYYDEAAYFKISLVSTYFSPDVLYFFNTGIFYAFDNDVNTVNYYSHGEIVWSHKAVIGIISTFPLTAPTGDIDEEFSHWIKGDGTVYDGTVITEDMLVNNAINFYAYFNKVTPLIVGPVTDLSASEDSSYTVILTQLGFNDPIERTIVFGFVAVLTAFGLMYKGVSSFATLIVIAIELVFFMYLGVIPMFAAIIVIITLAFIAMAFGGGEVSG